MIVFSKTPSEVLDYSFDWDDFWLQESEIISASDWTIYAENGEDPVVLEIDSENNTISLATVWVSGGTAGARYRLRNAITTNQGRTAERTIYLDIAEDLPNT